MADLHANPHLDLAGYLLGGLDPAEEGAFAEHLAGCEACQAELQELSDLPGLLADVRVDFPRLLRLWKAGRLDLEGMISKRADLDGINQAFDDMKAGRVIRTVIEV